MAVTSVTTAMAGAINYTVVTDSSADWASVSNSTYFYDKTDKLVHYKDSTGTVQEIFSGSGITVGTTPVTSGTDGRVFFQAGGVVQQDGAFNWDNTNKRLGIGANATSPSAALFLRTNTLVANDIFTIQNGQYGNGIFKVRDNVTTSQSSIGSIFVQARMYNDPAANQTAYAGQFDLGGFGLGASYGDNGSNAVWLNNQGNVGDGAGTSVISVATNLYVNLQTTKKYKFEAVTGNFGIGNVGSLGARLDVRAADGLSNLAFRVRNSVDSVDLFSVQGNAITNFGGGTSSGSQLQVVCGALGFGTNLTLQFAASRSISCINGGQVETGIRINHNSNTRVAGLMIGSSTSTQVFIDGGENIRIGQGFSNTNQPDANATRTIQQMTGVAPTTSVADGFQQYSADITAGNAAPHFRTENGAIVKVYQETTAVGASTLVSNAGTTITDTDTFDGYTLKQIVKALRNQGLLA